MNLKNHHLNLISKLTLFVVLAIMVKRCTTTEKELPKLQEIKEDMKFGYNMNNFFVVQDTIRRGESFGEILSRYDVDFSQIYKIANQTKDIFDIRQLRAGKPYMLLCSKDEKRTPQSFIYQPNKIEYVVLEFCDSIIAYKQRKPVKIVEKEAFGEIKSSLSETMEAQGLPIQLIYDMSDDIYAWTIDFFRLQEGDNFKVIYKQRFVEDSIYAGIESIDAAYFEHKGEPIYAFDYITPESKNSTDYYESLA